MFELVKNPEFWKAITGLAWPLVALIAIFKAKPIVETLLGRQNMTFKVGSLELTVKEAAQVIGKDVSDLQNRVADIELSRASHSSEVVTKQNKNRSQNKISKILWVDDFPTNNAFLIEKFIENKIDVVLSISTEDAMKKLANEIYEIVITDLGRIENGVDNPLAGMDFIKLMKSRKIATPILVFASRRGLEYKEKLLSFGATDVTSSAVEVIKFVEKYTK
ncbi:MAG: response regulator [Phyllobacteriaceae bacterium]|nr:response regulator [Phyllobacteriaceae bacterium]